MAASSFIEEKDFQFKVKLCPEKLAVTIQVTVSHALFS
jgi:hypothetical protein